ncbi:hypothetical protein ACF0H5_009086 [Mactra antiquata]
MGLKHTIKTIVTEYCQQSSRKLWLKLGVYIVTVLLVLPYLCYNREFSTYQLLTRQNETVLKMKLIEGNRIRYQRSLDILNQSKSTILQGFPKPATSVSSSNIVFDRVNNTKLEVDKKRVLINEGIAITIITVSRDLVLNNDMKTHYLLQSVSEFVSLLNRSKPTYNVHLSVCNVDSNPEEHEDVKLLPPWIPVYNAYTNIQRTYSDLNAILDKERKDYVFCMNKSLEQNLSYVMLVEDDALPHSDLFGVLETHVIENKLGQFRDLEKALYIKLYHPTRLLGYISLDIERIPELISISLLCSLLTTWILTTIFPRSSTMTIFAISILVCVCTTLFIGRATIVNFRRISRYLYQITPAPGCCTPAMLFPRAGATLIGNYLQTIKCKRNFGKDIALVKFARENGYKTRYIQPNLFQHIGHYSSLRGEFIKPYIVD